MSNHSKKSNALPEVREESLPEAGRGELAEIIPWPDVRAAAAAKPKKVKPVRLEGKYIYHRSRKISILHFQKSGYDRLLKLLVKEIG
jgi:hypothetical protein